MVIYQRLVKCVAAISISLFLVWVFLLIAELPVFAVVPMSVRSTEDVAYVLPNIPMLSKRVNGISPETRLEPFSLFF